MTDGELMTDGGGVVAGFFMGLIILLVYGVVAGSLEGVFKQVASFILFAAISALAILGLVSVVKIITGLLED